MIKLNFGTRSYPLSQEEAVYVAESLLSAVAGKKSTLPAFNSGRHGHISVLAEKPKPAKGNKGGEKRELPIKSAAIRSRPDRLLRKKARCVKKGFFLASRRCTVFPLPQNRQPGVGTRVTSRRHDTRHACFFTSLPQCAIF